MKRKVLTFRFLLDLKFTQGSIIKIGNVELQEDENGNSKMGRTNIVVNRNGFGALPVQRVNMEEAKVILKKAYDNGITFF